MVNRTEESLLQQSRIDDIEISRRKALFGFEPFDAAALMRARPHVLRMLAEVLRGISRENDILARLGGDEFCAVLPGVDGEGAHAFCARFVEALQERDRSTAVSIGVCLTGPVEFDEPDALLHMADVRMYEEKARHHAAPVDERAAVTPDQAEPIRNSFVA